MNFQKITPVAFLVLVMGSSCIYASYPYMSKWSENLAKTVIGKQKEMIDKVVQPEYPVGTFEHEHKRTI